MVPSSADPTLFPGGTNTVREWLSENYPKLLALLDKFESDLRMGQLSTPQQTDRLAITVRTVDILKTMIGSTRWKTPAHLVAVLRGLGRELEEAGGFREPAIGNVVRRTIAAVREEVLNPAGGTAGGGSAEDDLDNYSNNPPSRGRADRSSLESMLWALPQHVRTPISRGGMSSQDTSSLVPAPRGERQQLHSRSESVSSVGDALERVTTSNTVCSDLPPIFFQPSRSDLKPSIMEAIQEITSDFEDLNKSINDHATNHIHSGEIILTYGKSRTVERFLKAAASRKIRFTVIVCEGAPHYEGHAMAKALVTSDNSRGIGDDRSGDNEPSSGSSLIDIIVIPDSAIFATMARVNKVILPAHAVLANGGLVAPSGSNLAVLAARQNSVPVVCLTGIFKLTPLFPHEGQDTLNDLLSPSPIVEYVAQQQQQEGCHRRVDFVNPLNDYIQPQHISLYVTNVGSFQPSYVYRLLSEYYHPDDWAPF
jgi:translation initiation factor eIF-2B subunit beta